MSIKVSVRDGEALSGTLYYSRSEYSFRFEVDDVSGLAEKVGHHGVASLAVGTLQIEVDIESMSALYVWGLHPDVKWREGSVALRVPVREGKVVIDVGSIMSAGVALEIAAVNEWGTTFDSLTGWARVAPHGLVEDEIVLIATGVGLGIVNLEIGSVWLNPLVGD
ncbi:hypothetical protein [Kutzneria sp. CA-103260]|uniref:hypothetical protein n=1 Tax=Kutzneria sp. CA-103260 TaxID=2802641 RepID=UPI001BAA3AB9|nr:hypothetical protein [Kutzneria sp. CA-103260]